MHAPSTQGDGAIDATKKRVTKQQILDTVREKVKIAKDTVRQRYTREIYGRSGFTAALEKKLNEINRKTEEALRRQEAMSLAEATELITSVLAATIEEFNGKARNILNSIQRPRREADHSNILAAVEDAKILLGTISREIEGVLTETAVAVRETIDPTPVKNKPFAEIDRVLEELDMSISTLERLIASVRDTQRERLRTLERIETESRSAVERLIAECQRLRAEHERLHAETSDPAARDYEQNMEAMLAAARELRIETETMSEAERKLKIDTRQTAEQSTTLETPLPEETTLQQERGKRDNIQNAVVTVVTGEINPPPTDFAGVDNFIQSLGTTIDELEIKVAKRADLETAKTTAEAALREAKEAYAVCQTELEGLEGQKTGLHETFAAATEEEPILQIARQKIDLLSAIAAAKSRQSAQEETRSQRQGEFTTADEALTAVHRDAENLAQIKAQHDRLTRAILEAFERTQAPDSTEAKPEIPAAERLRAAIEQKKYGVAIRTAIELFTGATATERVNPADVKFQRACITDLIRVGKTPEADTILQSMQPNEYGHRADFEEYLELLFALLCLDGKGDEAETLIEPAEALVGKGQIVILLAYTYFYTVGDNEKAKVYCEQFLAQEPTNKGMLRLKRKIDAGESTPEGWRTTLQIIGNSFENGFFKTGLARYEKVKAQPELQNEKGLKIVWRKIGQGITNKELDARRLEEILDAYSVFVEDADATTLEEWKPQMMINLRAVIVNAFTKEKIEFAYAMYQKVRQQRPEILEGTGLETKIAAAFIKRFPQVDDIDMESVRIVRPDLEIGAHSNRNDPLATAIGEAVLTKIRRADRTKAAENPNVVRLGLQLRLEAKDAKNARAILDAMAERDLIPEGEEDAYEAAVASLEKKA